MSTSPTVQINVQTGNLTSPVGNGNVRDLLQGTTWTATRVMWRTRTRTFSGLSQWSLQQKQNTHHPSYVKWNHLCVNCIHRGFLIDTYVWWWRWAFLKEWWKIHVFWTSSDMNMLLYMRNRGPLSLAVSVSLSPSLCLSVSPWSRGHVDWASHMHF